MTNNGNNNHNVLLALLEMQEITAQIKPLLDRYEHLNEIVTAGIAFSSINKVDLQRVITVKDAIESKG